MSSARRLQEDYRRILGITEDTRGIDPDLPRMRIEGQRGIWEIGNNELKSGAAAGEDRDPVTPTETNGNQNADGSGQGDRGTGNGSGGGGSSITDGSDFIIDPEDQPAPLDPFDNTFGDGWGSGTGVITFQDCEDNTCIEIVERGGYIPPEGWDDPDAPPIDPSWVQGWWLNGGTNIGNKAYLTPQQAYDDAASTRSFFSCAHYKSGYILTDTSDPNRKSFAIVYRVVDNPNPTFCFREPGTPFNSVSGSFLSCSSQFNSLYCPLSTPPVPSEFWPADGCIQLAPNDNGNWQASSRENPDDMTAKYTQEFSRLELCNSSGETIWIDKNNRGGYTYLNVEQGVWRSTDASGKPRAFGSSSTHKFELR